MAKYMELANRLGFQAARERSLGQGLAFSRNRLTGHPRGRRRQS